MIIIIQQAIGAALGSVVIAASAIVPLESMVDPLLGKVPTEITYSRPTRAISTENLSSTENYLPRKLYPGTYGEFCGPTPEMGVKKACAVHGWHGNNPIDRVDEACELHDVAYCNCEDELIARRKVPLDEITMLSSMSALRFATKPLLQRTAPVDKEYFDCINRADRQIISTGIQVRSEMQRSGCSADPTLSWFCDVGQGTLGTFEKVNLDIFLRDLDFDDHQKDITLQELERQRQIDLRRGLKYGKSISDAASSDSVREDERMMLRRLLED